MAAVAVVVVVVVPLAFFWGGCSDMCEKVEKRAVQTVRAALQNRRMVDDASALLYRTTPAYTYCIVDKESLKLVEESHSLF